MIRNYGVPGKGGRSRAETGLPGEADRRGRHHSHLTESILLEGLQKAAELGWGAPALARYLGISVPTATQILAGKTWKHVPRPAALARQVRKRAVKKRKLNPSSSVWPPEFDHVQWSGHFGVRPSDVKKGGWIAGAASPRRDLASLSGFRVLVSWGNDLLRDGVDRGVTIMYENGPPPPDDVDRFPSHVEAARFLADMMRALHDPPHGAFRTNIPYQTWRRR